MKGEIRIAAVKVYRQVKFVRETCPACGCTHDVSLYEVKRLTPTGETREHDNGWEKRQTSLYTDAQGRVYHVHIPIDFGGSASFVRDGDSKSFSRHVLRPARDLMGNVLL